MRISGKMEWGGTCCWMLISEGRQNEVDCRVKLVKPQRAWERGEPSQHPIMNWRRPKGYILKVEVWLDEGNYTVKMESKARKEAVEESWRGARRRKKEMVGVMISWDEYYSTTNGRGVIGRHLVRLPKYNLIRNLAATLKILKLSKAKLVRITNQVYIWKRHGNTGFFLTDFHLKAVMEIVLR